MSADQDVHAYIANARHELAGLRSDILGGLGSSSGDLHLKASFLTSIDAADLSLKKALR